MNHQSDYNDLPAPLVSGSANRLELLRGGNRRIYVWQPINTSQLNIPSITGTHCRRGRPPPWWRLGGRRPAMRGSVFLPLVSSTAGGKQRGCADVLLLRWATAPSTGHRAHIQCPQRCHNSKCFSLLLVFVFFTPYFLPSAAGFHGLFPLLLSFVVEFSFSF